MAHHRCRPRPTQAKTLTPVATHCPECGHRLWADYSNFRTVTTLDAVIRLTLHIRRCPNPAARRYHRPYRPEAEPHFALPHHEFGLDVLALVGRLRHAEHRSVPEIHRGIDPPRRRRRPAHRHQPAGPLRRTARPGHGRSQAACGPLLRQQGRVVLAIDGLQPDVGHEVLWVLRDCLSGEVLLAKSLLSATIKDLDGVADRGASDALPVPITGVISDGQDTIRKAVARTLPGVPHQSVPLPLPA